MGRSVQNLDSIELKVRCHVAWESMTGDERMRHCSDCRLKVYNLSEMTREEALSFLNRSEGRVCIRYYKRPDGTVVTRDCRQVVAQRARRKTIVGSAIAAALVILATMGSWIKRWFPPGEKQETAVSIPKQSAEIAIPAVTPGFEIYLRVDPFANTERDDIIGMVY
jgi:hypothetical protein